jgi:hypothetical protein
MLLLGFCFVKPINPGVVSGQSVSQSVTFTDNVFHLGNQGIIPIGLICAWPRIIISSLLLENLCHMYAIVLLKASLP